MNAIYKVIWNDAIRQYQVVNELCRSRRKACSVKAVHTDGGNSVRKLAVAVGASLVALGSMGSAWAVTNQNGILVFDESLVLEAGGATLNGGSPIELTEGLLNGVTGFDFSNFTIQGTIDASTWDDDVGLYFSNVHVPDGVSLGDSYTVTIGGQLGDYIYDNSPAYKYSFTPSQGEIYDRPEGLFMHLKLTGIESLDGTLYRVNTLKDETATGEKDLTAKLTGAGDFEYVVDNREDGAAGGDDTTRYGGEGSIIVNNETNAYSGITNIGYVANGEVQDKVIVTAGSDNIFGSEDNGAYTSLLNIKTNSGLEMKDTEQWVHALAGGGYLNLEDGQSLLHVKDDSRDLQSDVMEVYNKLSGAGTVWIDFADNDQGGGIHFNVDSNDQFSGWVVLQDAYTEVRGEDTPIFHNEESHLLVAENGVLKVFGTENNSPSTTHISNLSIGFSYQDDGFDKTSMTGTLVGEDSEALFEFNVNPSDTVHDYLIVDNLQVGKAQVTIDTSEWGDEFVERNSSLLTADEGENKTLIRVTGNGKDEPGDLVVITPVQKQMIKVGNIDVAEATWSFDKKLTKVSDNQDGADWAIAYSLSQVDLRDASGAGLVLSVADDAASDADRDFTAKITGSGNLTIRGDVNGDNDAITLGKNDNSGVENSYSGATFVCDGATVIFQADKAMGNTSSLKLEEGTKVDFSGFDQTVLNLSGTGTLVVDEGAVFTLDKSTESGTITVNAILEGAAQGVEEGTFVVKSSGGSFEMDLDGEVTAFNGNVRLENTSVTLTGDTAGALSGSTLDLYGTSDLHVAADGGQLAGLKNSSGAGNIIFDGFNLGVTGGTSLELANGAGSASGNFTIALPDKDSGFNIVDGIRLIEYDNEGNSQTIIKGQLDSSDFTLKSNGIYQGVEYKQGGSRVARTDWTVELVGTNDGLGLNETLTGIELLATGENALVIETDSASSATGSALQLAANVTGSGNILFRGNDTKPIEFNNGRGQANTYTGKTIVESGRLNLGSDYVLGQTSLLDVRNGATVDLMGKTQVIHGLDGTGTININNGTLNLSKTGDQAIENLFGPDTGILAVNLSGGKLSFAGNSDFGSSKLDLTNTILELSGRTETAMDTANVAANAQSKIVVNSHDKLGSLELNGGEIEFGSIVLGDESGSSKLDITGILSGSGTVTISRDDLSVSDKLNLLDADNSNLVQTVISAGQISGTPVLGTTIDDLENVSVQSGAALTKWTLSDGLVKVDNDYGIGYQLTEIALQSGHTLNLAAGKDSELSAYVTGSGSISFNGGDITVSNSSNNFSGNTTVKSGSVTLGNTGVLGQTNVLTLEEGTSLYINGFTQTVHALKGVGTVDFGTAQSGTLTVQYTDGESAHTVLAIALKAMLARRLPLKMREHLRSTGPTEALAATSGVRSLSRERPSICGTVAPTT